MSRNTTRAAIGPAASLGRLYDATTDSVLSRSIFSTDIPAEAIESNENPNTDSDFSMSDSLCEKFNKLNFDAELTASFLGGLVSVSGSGHYLSQAKPSAHLQQASVICKIKTVSETLRIRNDKLLAILDLDALEHNEATHVITGIQWGARSVVTVKSERNTSDDILEFGGMLGADRGSMKAFKSSEPSSTLKGETTKQLKEEPENQMKDQSIQQVTKQEGGTREGQEKQLGNQPLAKQDGQPKEGQHKQPEDQSNQQLSKQDSKQPSTAQLAEHSKTPGKKDSFMSIKGLVKSIGQAHTEGSFAYKKTKNDIESSFEFKINADIAVGTIPTTYKGVCEFVENMPQAMKTANEGKGVPLSYNLMPLAELAKAHKPQIDLQRLVYTIDEDCVASWVEYFEKLALYKQKISDYIDLLSLNKHCVPFEHMEKARKVASNLNKAEKLSKRRFRECLQAVRSGEENMQALQKLLIEEDEETSMPSTGLSITSQYLTKIKQSRDWQRYGARYIENDTSELHRHYHNYNHRNQDLYVLYYSEATQKAAADFLPTYKTLMELLKDSDHGHAYSVIVVDCDVGSPVHLQQARIERIRGGEVIVADVVADYLELSERDLLRCRNSQSRDRDNIPPAGRRIVRIECPKDSCCGDGVREWICPTCRDFVYFGYTDNYLYCECGRFEVDKAEFKCKSKRHGSPYEKYSKDLYSRLRSLEPFEEYNILILGQTGVGKSTFINAFMNYIQFDSMDEALEDKGSLRYIIPNFFTFDDEEDGETKTFAVKVGSEGEFERFQLRGRSATRRSVTYQFFLEGKLFRLIDTPGIGDTDGIAQDKLNMEDILNTLKTVKKISTVLFLVKPYDARASPAFNFVLTELLAHLHKDTSRNIVFGCTSSRTSLFRMGDARAPLEDLLLTKNTGIELGDQNTFFFDSEGFRYLAAMKLLGRSIGAQDIFEESWKKSSDEARRLLRTTLKLPMHSVQMTLTMNETRNMITKMTKPMIAMSIAIKTTKTKIEKAIVETRELLEQGLQLDKKLDVDYIVPVEKKVPWPRTVCCHKDCTKRVRKGERSVTEYKQICHDNCKIASAGDEIMADPNLTGCSAFDCKGHDCSQCGHGWNMHMHIRYRIEYENQQNPFFADILANTSNLDKATETMNGLKAEEMQLDNDNKLVQRALAKFGVFLKDSAMSTLR